VAGTIAILDDDAERIEAMVHALSRHLPDIAPATFDNAPEMIDWLGEHLDRCLVICLDHDLGANRIRDGNVFDPGTGRDVVDFLAAHVPVCPVIIHTTNSLAAPGMEAALEETGWHCSRVVPYDDLAWIGEWWLEEVQKALKEQ
jgi:hypothetical protein